MIVNKEQLTPLNSTHKTQFIELINNSLSYELVAFLSTISPYSEIKKVQLVDIYAEGILFNLTVDINQLLQEYFYPFAKSESEQLEQTNLLIMQILAKLDKTINNKEQQFSLLAKRKLTTSFMRLTLQAQNPLNFLMKPAHYAAFVVAPKQSRAYTYRRFDLKLNQIELDIFLHGTTATAQWLEQLQVGDIITSQRDRGELVGNIANGSVVLYADETGFPAIAALLEHWCNPQPALVLLEALNEQDFDYFVDCDLADSNVVKFIAKDKYSYGLNIVNYFQQHQPKVDAVFGACDAQAMRLVRKQVQDKYQLGDDKVVIRSYWNSKHSS